MDVKRGEFVYVLKDPWSGDVRYIGRTRDIVGRRTAHLNWRCASPSSPLGRWLAFLKSEGVFPKFVVMLAAYGRCDLHAAKAVEKQLIAFYTDEMDGHIILNVDGNPRMSYHRDNVRGPRKRRNLGSNATLSDVFNLDGMCN